MTQGSPDETGARVTGQALPVYDSDSSQTTPMRNGITELLRYKDLLRLLITTNITTRYKRSILGVAWTLLSPLLTMTVMSIAFSALFRFSVPNYPVYVLAGLLFFGFFQESTTQGMTALIWGSALLKKVYIPASVFPISAVGTGIVNLCLSLIPLFAIMVIIGRPPTWSLLFVPVAMVMTAVLSLGVGLILSTIAVVFSDVVEMWVVIVRALFYLTPVMYPERIFPERLQWIFQVNPLYHLIHCWRDPIYYGTLPAMDTVLKALVWCIGTFFVGWWVFSRRAHQFALRA